MRKHDRRAKWVCSASLLVGAAGVIASCGGSIGSDLFTDPRGPDGSSFGNGDASLDGMGDGSPSDGGLRDGSQIPPVAYDGICTPRSMMSGFYDPDCVYLLGTVDEGYCGHDALVLPSQPNDSVFGFGCGNRFLFVRPTDGRLLFIGATGIGYDPKPARLYRPKPHDGGPWYIGRQVEQEAVPTPGCENPDSLFIFPDDGTLLYRCAEAGGYVDSSGRRYDLRSHHLLAVGENRALFGSKDGKFSVIVNDSAAPVKGSPSFHGNVAIRSRRGGGFLFATNLEAGGAALFDVEATGSAALRGKYQPRPGWGAGPDCALESTGALICITPDQVVLDSGMTDPYEKILRYTFDDPPEVIYDERANSVKIHIATLVTGP